MADLILIEIVEPILILLSQIPHFTLPFGIQVLNCFSILPLQLFYSQLQLMCLTRKRKHPLLFLLCFFSKITIHSLQLLLSFLQLLFLHSQAFSYLLLLHYLMSFHIYHFLQLSISFLILFIPTLNFLKFLLKFNELSVFIVDYFLIFLVLLLQSLQKLGLLFRKLLQLRQILLLQFLNIQVFLVELPLVHSNTLRYIQRLFLGHLSLILDLPNCRIEFPYNFLKLSDLIITIFNSLLQVSILTIQNR